ncbi:MAG: hypothetical protein ACP5JG_07215 [Anaerolineae bacterium]
MGWKLIPLVLLLLATTSCETVSLDVNLQNTPTPQVLSQWAVSATASSHYGMPDWSPNRATGPPDVNACADDARAWASARGSGVEWLQLEYSTPVHVVEVRIHQTYGRGALSRVTLIDVSGQSLVVWEGEDAREPCPGLLTVGVARTEGKVATVRIDLDESRTGYWNQIDAVELIGMR